MKIFSRKLEEIIPFILLPLLTELISLTNICSKGYLSLMIKKFLMKINYKKPFLCGRILKESLKKVMRLYLMDIIHSLLKLTGRECLCILTLGIYTTVGGFLT